MNSRKRIVPLFVIGLCALPVVQAEDWPAYMKNARRSPITEDGLDLPLKVDWIHESAQRPAPAWPDPITEKSPLDFTFLDDISEPVALDYDYAYHPIIVGGTVYYGSSADDSVRALSLDSGEVLWRFPTGGPVRFAPAHANGRLYVASDDGFLYCLAATDGTLKWRFRAAPSNRQVMGNGRLISRWPLRSGALATENVVYVTAGMWPSEGVYVYAIDAKTGEKIWVNDTSGALSTKATSYSLTGVAPQGYLLAYKDYLVVPTGRSVPATYSRSTGELLYFAQPTYHGQGGGHWASISEEGHICFGFPRERFSGKHNGIFTVKKLPMLNHGVRDFRASAVLMHKFAVTAGNGFLTRYQSRKKSFWRVPFPEARTHCLVQAGSTLFVGGDQQLLAYELETGTNVWESKVFAGQVKSVAISGQRLLAATDRGRIYGFSSITAAASAATTNLVAESVSAAPAPSAAGHETALALIDKTALGKGQVLLVGDESRALRLARLIAGRTELEIAVVIDQERATAARKTLLDTTRWLGTRIAVVSEPSGLPDYFADIILCDAEVDAAAVGNLYRVLSPCGGVLHVENARDLDKLKTELLAQVADEGEIRPDATHLTVVRGKLPGAADWDTTYAKDKRVKWPIELLWFGEPGPKRMQSGGLTPISANGRQVIGARNHLMVLDAYNGVELWSRTIPFLWRHILRAASGRGAAASLIKRLAADDDRVYLGLGDLVFQLDAQTGEQQDVFGTFKPPEVFSLRGPVSIFLGEHQLYEDPAKPPDVLFKEDASIPSVARAEISQTADAVKIQLETALETVVVTDHLEIFIDTRPADQRHLLHDTEIAHFIVYLLDGRVEDGTGRLKPRATARSEREGKTVVVSIPKDALFRNAEATDSFALELKLNHEAGAAFKFRSGKRARKYMRWHAFGDDSAYAVNQGWAEFFMAAPRAMPAIAATDPAELPEAAKKWTRTAPRGKKSAGMRTLDRQRTNPLKLTEGPVVFNRGKGCGYVISAESMQIMRASTLGFYDTEDDSGMRYFGGVRAGCTVSMAPALGVLFAAEGSPTCSCNYSYKCSVTLAPASQRRMEDWALYQDEVPLGSEIRAGNFNLGAPGDRRDDDGKLWLQYPRAPATDALTMPVPLLVEGKELTPFRYNADHTPIAGTTRPWIYASGLEGVEHARVNLFFSDKHAVISFPVSGSPKVDAELDESHWDGKYVKTNPPRRNSQWSVRHDEESLYIARTFTRLPDRRGDVEPWGRAEDALVEPYAHFPADAPFDDFEVWNEDGLAFHFGDATRKRILVLGVSVTGERFDGLCLLRGKTAKPEDTDPVFSCPWEAALKVEGNTLTSEWRIPWDSFTKAGLDIESLRIRLNSNLPNYMPIYYHGYVPLWTHEGKPTEKMFAVKLHFAEMRGAKAGERVFDIKIQDKVVAAQVDIAAESEHERQAVVKVFDQIALTRDLEIELVPKVGQTMISGIEIIAEN